MDTRDIQKQLQELQLEEKEQPKENSLYDEEYSGFVLGKGFIPNRISEDTQAQEIAHNKIKPSSLDEHDLFFSERDTPVNLPKRRKTIENGSAGCLVTFSKNEEGAEEKFKNRSPNR